MPIGDIVCEFNIDHGLAQELIGEITNPIALKFIEILGNNQYRLTESGSDEVAFCNVSFELRQSEV